MSAPARSSRPGDADAARLGALGPWAPPSDGDGPAFEESWHAEAFAVVVTLHEAGAFTWDEWVDALATAIAAAQAAGDPDLGDTYYDHWLAALEGLCLAKGLVVADQIDRREGAWREAYLRTPHGEPVLLEAD